MMRLGKFTAIAGGMVMALSGCDSNGGKTVEVDGHVFIIPKEHLVQGTIPWLPASQSEGVKFIVNPSDRREEQMIVTIESSAKTCHPQTAPATNQLAVACDAALQKRDNGNRLPIEKVINNNDPTQWYYKIKGDGDDKDVIVASCYALSDDGKSGLCTAISNYDNMVYSLGLRDIDVVKLPLIHGRVNGLLHSWEVKSKAN